MCSSYHKVIMENFWVQIVHLDRSSAILTSDDFVRSNEMVKTKWPIY